MKTAALKKALKELFNIYREVEFNSSYCNAKFIRVIEKMKPEQQPRTSKAARKSSTK